MISGCQSITQFVRVIAEHCLDKRCRDDLLYITEQILTITNQLTIISSVNAATASCKSSNEILVKNAQSLLHVILRGIRAAEAACIKGLKQPDPDSDGAEAAVLCLQWRRNLLIHRAQQNSCLETDELGLRKTSQYLPGPSLAAPVYMKEAF
ncbi:vinculin isoform X2 [Paramormyrops kingsleyae]